MFLLNILNIVKRRYKKICILLSIIVILLVIIMYYSDREMRYSLNDALSYYGFDSTEQKSAMQDLLQQSSIIPSDQSLLAAFPPRSTKDQLALDILTMVKGTQSNLSMRVGTKERWEMQSAEWMTENKTHNIQNLKILGFINAIVPVMKKAEALCILGATGPTMLSRIEYANSLLESGLKASSVILLTGERYVNTSVDGTEEELAEIADKFALSSWREVTETHLMQDLYNQSDLHDKGLTLHVIDTPRQDLPRPTTQTTALELVSWLKLHDEIQSIIFISNQPHVKYQNCIIDTVFNEQGCDMPHEVVGASADIDQVQSIIEGLSAYIWAATPKVLATLNITVNSKVIEEAVKHLYSKTPLVYRSIPRCFTR